MRALLVLLLALAVALPATAPAAPAASGGGAKQHAKAKQKRKAKARAERERRRKRALQAPAPSGTIAPFAPFAPGNPFTTPIPAQAPLLPAGEQAVRRGELRFLLRKGAGLEQANWSSSLYRVLRDGRILDSRGTELCRGTFARPSGGLEDLNGGIDGRGWPTGPCLRPEAGEGHMVLYAPETGTYGEFYATKVSGGRISYGYGGYVRDTRTVTAMATPELPWRGSTASGAPVGAFTITEAEIRHAVARYEAGDHAAAVIPHVLGYEAWRHTASTWEFPATKTDFMGPGPGKVPEYGAGSPDGAGHGHGPLPMGGLWRLDPRVDVQRDVRGDGTPRGDMLARIVARTLQRYGATMTDQTGAGLVFLAEQPARDGFAYGHTGPNAVPWVSGLLAQALDRGWVQFLHAGRHLEIDAGAPAPAGA
ncbi:MAG TPA: hypothetical protein VN238_13865, partial [Solirubrobacteraceae bacterium]|nr:hypothetical protein [Solirubrobacteraceae bacterium]